MIADIGSGTEKRLKHEPVDLIDLICYTGGQKD